MTLHTTQLYTKKFNIIAPPKGLESIMPYTVEMTPANPDDIAVYDLQTRFDLNQLRRHIGQTLVELSENSPHEDPERHPDISTLRVAYATLETKQNPDNGSNHLGLTPNIK